MKRLFDWLWILMSLGVAGYCLVHLFSPISIPDQLTPIQVKLLVIEVRVNTVTALTLAAISLLAAWTLFSIMQAEKLLDELDAADDDEFLPLVVTWNSESAQDSNSSNP